MRAPFLVSFAVLVACFSCGSKVSHPAPEYKKSELPPWQAPVSKDDGMDVFDLTDGEWVTEDGEEDSEDAATGSAGSSGIESEISPNEG